jgi:hypothetical protein
MRNLIQRRSVQRWLVLAACLGAAPACGDEDMAEMEDDAVETSSSASASAMPSDEVMPDAGVMFDPQLPPTDPVLAEAWLDMGYYMDWVCEETPTTKTDGAPAIHVHGASSRVCANILLAATPKPEAGEEFPKGVAAVKEVYDEANALVARFIEVKTEAASDGGNGWYWLRDGGAVSGFGFAGCTDCHGAAGADADHPGAGDYVYWQQTDPAQLPPVGNKSAMSEWLEAGHYNDWDCESEATEKTDGVAGIHAHGTNRVCSNQRLAENYLVEGQWQAGVASVKELFTAGGELSGVAVAVKVRSDSDEGAGWYWSEGDAVAGFGVGGCTGCHLAADSDADHPGAGDLVYFRNTH